MVDQVDFLQRSEAPALAFSHFIPAQSVLPTVVFLGGFRSDMQGSKALSLDEFCRQRGQPFIRFDYRGHGRSEGLFEDGTIGLWFQDALDIIDQMTTGPLVVVGSSMGGWIGLLVAQARTERVKGFIGIAAAPDFTADMDQQLNDQQKDILKKEGILRIPSQYSDEPYVITQALLADGPHHFLINKPLNLQMPVRLVQGMKDTEVEWQTAHRIKMALTGSGNEDVEVLLVEEGDHRLSRPQDLSLIHEQVCVLSG